jgi:hypothetical protein
VPPTDRLVVKFYGMRYMATLFGIVMMSHQVGGFLGAWLGGMAFESDRQLRLDVVGRHRPVPYCGGATPADSGSKARAGPRRPSSGSLRPDRRVDAESKP